MAEIDIILLTAILGSVLSFAGIALVIRQANAERRALQGRPPHKEPDLDDFITRLNAARTDEEVNQLERERNRQWPNSSLPLSSG